jgi:type IV pilus assembly protein PilM
MGIWQLFEKSLVGLDIGVSGIKAVELSPGKSRRLMAYNRIPLPWNTISPDGEIKNREVLINALRALFANKEFTSKKVATAGFGNSIITKKIQVDRMKPEELREQIYWEAEQYIPFDVNDVNLDFAILGSSHTMVADKMDVLLVVAKKDYIQNLQDLLEEAGLAPTVIDTQSFALGNSFEFNYGHLTDLVPGGNINILVDFGAGSTKVSVFEGDKTTFTRDLRQSGMNCSLMISERLGVSLDEAESLKIHDAEDSGVSALLAEYNTGLAEEVSRTIDFCLSQSVDASLDGVYVCGGGSRAVGLIPLLSSRLTAPVKPLNPVQNIAGSGKRMNAHAIQEMMYLGSVAVGLALRKGGAK